MKKNLVTQKNTSNMSVKSTGGVFNKVKEMRERTIARDNWNYFVGDPDYKTNFFLQFKSPFISMQYSKHLIASSVFSLRIMCQLIFLVNLFIASSSKLNMLTGLLAYSATFPVFLKN
jgi:hypothetical protein